MIEFLGFSPDAEPQTPGAILDCQNIVPYESGLKAAPQPISVGLPALAIACKGAAVLRDLSGNSRFIAGTASALYEASGTAWLDVSTATASYSLGDDEGWDFAQFGNTALAATPSKRVQRSTGTTFAEITSAPRCEVIDSVNGFVMALNTNETVYGTSPDRWWCSALFDETDWTPAVATQATTGRLIDGLGKLTAGRRFGTDFVAYKERGVFLGRYVGPPAAWDWTMVSEDVGCVGKDAVVQTNIGHVFVGLDNVYLFDGTRPIPLATGLVRQWWQDNSSGQYRARTKLLWDRLNSLVWMYFASKESDGTPDYCLVFHTISRRWGRADTTVQAVVNYYTSGAFTYDGTSPLISTYDASEGAGIPFDSVLWLAEREVPAVFVSGQPQALEAGADDSFLTTGDYGSDKGAVMAKRVIMNFAQAPEIADIQGYTKAGSGRALEARSTSELNDSAFDIRQTGRFHRFRISFSGDVKFDGFDLELEPAGVR
jgi:hypothetical protein